jgi:HSP20 family protein
MANITRFDPFAELVRFDPLGDFESIFRRPPGVWRKLADTPDIKMDVTEDEKGYRVKAEIPGVRKDDIKVSIEGNQVSIGTEVKKEQEEKTGEKVIRTERYYGSQYRAFMLPQEVDPGRSEAKYENGVLELTLPKKEGTTARQLAVK